MFHVKHFEPDQSVREYLGSLSLRQGGEQALPILARYVELLLRHASHRNLVSATQRSPEALWSHVFDSLQALSLPSVLSAPMLIDAGSGGGLPGIPIAIARPDASVLLVERGSAKAEFLELARALVPVRNIEVQCKELSLISSSAPVLARALVQPGAWPALVRNSGLCGTWIIYSTENNRADWEQAAATCDLTINSTHEYTLPGKSATRSILEFTRR